MALEFPRARLLVYDRLVNGGDCCVQALVKSSVELGLISDQHLDELRIPDDGRCCGSMFAARRLLEAALSMRGHCMNNGGMEIADSLWINIQRDVDHYKRETKLEHDRENGTAGNPVDCSHMAPVVLDILLQHLTPFM